jgi:hypothetical protein
MKCNFEEKSTDQGQPSTDKLSTCGLLTVDI